MITSVYIDTDELVFQLHSVSDDAQKALEWVRAFRDTLMFGARIPNPLPFAMECMAMSEGFSASGVLGKLRAAARKRLNDEGIEATPESIDAEIARTQGADAVRDIMAKIEHANRLKAEIRRRKFIAAATTREGVDVVPDREIGSLERTTGCNQSTADAPTREDGDERQHPSDGELLESGTSANHYDQVHAKTRDTRDDSRGRYAPPSCSPDDGNPAETAPSHGGSVASLEARQGQARESQHGAGEVTPESVSAPSPALPAKHPHGEFGNVMLTTDEYIKLCEKCQDADSLITELDQYIESQGKTKKYKSHYATLLNWSRRKATEAKQPSRYKNINDINRENCEQIERDLRAMFHPEEVI